MRNRKKARGKAVVPGLALKALFLAFALVAGLVERWIPFEFVVPGVKLGLANAVVLTALYLFPWPAALEISLLKCLMTAIFTGMGVSFFYSLGGAVFSFAAMAPALRFGQNKIGPAGVSVLGAVFHNIGQILVASLIMRTLMIVTYLPVLLISGVVTGVLVGMLVKPLTDYIRKHLIK
ncbi:MAG: Gx transporter family protein [Oscillospiraceae bacterium]|nr:Gx transporter family protein [Oscillospiraceae bacterium]